jgi:hypothetical protein
MRIDEVTEGPLLYAQEYSSAPCILACDIWRFG